MSECKRARNVLILAEGYEEKPYIDKVLSFPNICKDAYRIHPAVNLKGNSNILARFQYEIQRGFYDVILIFCDADKGSEQFFAIVRQLGAMFFADPKDALEVFLFVNPVTLQVVLLHFDDVTLTKVAKKANAEAVERLTGIKNYDAKQEQIEALVDRISYRSLPAFKNRLGKISTDVHDLPSTNFLLFLERFENDDTRWIDEIDRLRKP